MSSSLGFQSSANRGGRSAAANKVVGTAAVALLALYLVSRITEMERLPYFLDEGLYADFAYQGAQSSHQLFVSLSIGKEPLQAWLGIIWQWFGANPLASMRLVSVASGLATVGLVGLIGRRLGGVAVGLVAAALAVVLPFLVVNDAVGIEEPLVTLVMAAALYLQIALAQRPTLRRGAALGVVLAAGVLTKQSTEAAVVLIPASLVCLDLSPDGRRGRLGRWLAAVGVAISGVLAAELLMRSSDYWNQGQAFLRMGTLVRPFSAVISHPLATAPHAWAVFRPALIGYVTIPLCVLGPIGAALAWGRSRSLTAILLIWVVVPFLAALIFTLGPYPRHVIYVLPPALVLIAYAIVWLARRLTTLTPRPVAVVACAVSAVVILFGALRFDARALAHPRTFVYPGLDDVQYVTGVAAGGAWPAVVATIRRRGTGSRVITFVAQADPNIVRFLLSANPRSPANRYPVVTPGQPGVAAAQFAVVDQLPFEDLAALRFIAHHGFTVVRRVARPRGGAVVTLYERSR